MTIDEDWVYLNDCKKKGHFYNRKRSMKNMHTRFRRWKESFSKEFMIVAEFIYNGKLKIRRAGLKCSNQLKASSREIITSDVCRKNSISSVSQ